ncbi:beta-1,6-N-acetylglucosaminyltransferase [Paracoccus sp. p4-l81]|uniref:DUF5927 domain-containing protein n=1 Tax=Paracoccus sp. p4-l81 TaxID=3342806 RepID=UPI0035B6AF31
MTAYIGFVMMCHTAPQRAIQVVRHWVGQGAPVVIHVDAAADKVDQTLRAGLADLGDRVSFIARHRSTWGSWGLVAAAQEGAAQMLARHPEVTHVFLASGACLPLRPLAELAAYLDAHPDTDFIESVVTSEAAWAKGGLEDERFTLFFPFSWRHNRRLFDHYVALQRRIGLRRRIPDGLNPHLGSQWWCLTRETLRRVLDDPRRAEFERYFKGVWIPDESYFQTLARRHARRIESRSLTLNKFDMSGLPHIFYDDHLELLRRSELFVVRKVWPHAERLYQTFLTTPTHTDQPVRRVAPDSGRIDRIFNQSVERRKFGRAGLYMQSRFPRKGFEARSSAYPYVVFQGFSDVFPDLKGWLARRHIGRVHGHLFDREQVDFAGEVPIFDGAIPAHPELRDYNPRAFLTNLIWNGRGERQVILASARDRMPSDLYWFMVADPNATIHLITGAWAVPLYLSGKPVASIWREAARLQRIQTQQMKIIDTIWRRARVQVWTLSDFMQNPSQRLQGLVRDLQPGDALSMGPPLGAHDLTGFGRFLQQLRNQGLRPELMGDFDDAEILPDPAPPSA